MKKTIILSNGVTKSMTIEQVLKQFRNMIQKHANLTMSKFEGHIEREDLVQQLEIAAWEAFNEYDQIHAFSTILTFKLKGVTGNMAQKITAKKREHFSVSMNATIGDTEDLKLEDMFSVDDYTAENMSANEMFAVIRENIQDKREIEELQCIMDPKEFSVTKLAEKRGISRQAANQRVNKTKDKLKALLIENQFVLA